MSYDLIVVGTGPAGAFFLEEALDRLPGSARVLVLERGPRRAPAAWSADRGARSLYGDAGTWRASGMESKDWFVTVGFGGGSNCWYACTSRMLPEDFRTRTLHGVSEDWPVSYDDLEPWCCEVETRMVVSGRAEAFLPRSRPLPQRPHRWSSTDAALARLHPGRYTVQLTARVRDAVGGCPPYCASGVCHACPVGAKWTVVGDMADVLSDPHALTMENRRWPDKTLSCLG
jgi:choline dehydrogenase-like flavoprotein